MNTTIATDGCTGFPDKIGVHDFTTCCSIHDDGGTDGALLDCLDAAAPGFGWGAIFVVCILVMYALRPLYNVLQRLGIMPKTKGSKF